MMWRPTHWGLGEIQTLQKWETETKVSIFIAVQK